MPANILIKGDRVMTIIRDILYFEKPGKVNTDETLNAVKERATLLNINHVVVATNTGETALSCAKIFQGTGVKIIAVTLHAGRWKDLGSPDQEILEEFRKYGGSVLTATHFLIGNLGMAIRNRFGGISESELIGHTFYRFSQGVKVTVEIAVMASDAGLISTKEEIISIGGTARGADTALVLIPAYSNEFFNLEIKEIIAMPR